MKAISQIVLILSLASLALTSCQSEKPKASQFSDKNAAKADFQNIADVGDVIFWHATDKCLRENSEGLSQMSTLEDFTKKHECEIMDVKQVVDDKNKSFVATVKIHDPKVSTAWYELTYEEAGDGWQAIDGKLMTGGHEMNYFEGQFLSATNLKPYVDAATKEHMKK